jgi:hypothetical protein
MEKQTSSSFPQAFEQKIALIKRLLYSAKRIIHNLLTCKFLRIKLQPSPHLLNTSAGSHRHTVLPHLHLGDFVKNSQARMLRAAIAKIRVCLINPPRIHPKLWGKPIPLQPLDIAYVAPLLEKLLERNRHLRRKILESLKQPLGSYHPPKKRRCRRKKLTIKISKSQRTTELWIRAYFLYKCVENLSELAIQCLE